MFATQTDVVFLLVLFVAPILSTIFISLFSLLIDRDIPPILPQINSYSFAQAVVALAAAVIVSKGLPTATGAIGLIVLLLLFLILQVQSWLEKKEEVITRAHVSKVLDSKCKTCLREGVDLSAIKEIAYSLVDVDFFPDSLPNRLSDYPRRRRRQQLVNLIQSYLVREGADPELAEADFLLTPKEQHDYKVGYIVITAICFCLYMGSVMLSVLMAK